MMRLAMKSVAFAFLLVCTVPCFAETPAEKAFTSLKHLEGKWAGPKMGDMPMTATYKVTAAGSALVETLFGGTAHEMVTVYHLDGKKLILTHYCAAQNQPTMKLVSSVPGKEWRFDFISGTNMKSTDMHMHKVKHTLVAPDHLVSTWTSYKDGKAAGDVKIDLHRAK